MNLNELTKSIYVINLEDRNDRKDHITKELNKIDCKEYKIIDAVDGSKIKNLSKIKNGAYGLLMTYIKIYEDWSINKTENILIVEDDCVFTENFNDSLQNYINQVPKNWDILYFGANHNYHMGQKTEKINDFCIKLNNSYSAHCVLMKSYIFDELINMIKQTPIEVDVLLANLQRKYNAYSSHIALTTQLPSYSNIENKLVDNVWLIK
jgi:GR25 family glycosyltransferase involved in LPS biosynthesis